MTEKDTFHVKHPPPASARHRDQRRPNNTNGPGPGGATAGPDTRPLLTTKLRSSHRIDRIAAYREPIPATEPAAPTALLLRGSGSSLQVSLLYWSARVLSATGWQALGLEWNDGARDDARSHVSRPASMPPSTAPVWPRVDRREVDRGHSRSQSGSRVASRAPCCSRCLPSPRSPARSRPRPVNTPDRWHRGPLLETGGLRSDHHRRSTA